MKILFAGEGGQGVQAIAQILTKAGFKEGQSVSYIPNFGVEQRGGASLAFVTIQSRPVVYPKFDQADVLAILSGRSKKRVKDHIGPNTKVILGPAVKNGKKSKLPPRTWNVVVLGEINRQGKIVKKESLVKAMEEKFARQFQKNPELRKLDLEALGTSRK